jgi:hypothetical protein
MGKAIKTQCTKNKTTKMKLYLILFTTLVLTSCSDKKTVTKGTFFELIPKLKVLDISFSYDLMTQDDENCYHTNKKEDSLFTNYTISIIGLLPDTVENYKILYLYPGDDYYPFLRTYSKDGRKIDDQNICYTDCAGWDRIMDSCTSKIKLLDNETIERYYKMTLTDCDSLDNKIPSTTRTIIHRQTISVDKKGEIIFGKES